LKVISKNIEEIKRLYPDEWVLIANPVMDEAELNVLSGIPILNCKNKKVLCFLGENKVANFHTITIIYTGSLKSSRQLFYFNNNNRKRILSFKDTFRDMTKKDYEKYFNNTQKTRRKLFDRTLNI
jgi:hypothetical protein